MMKDLLIKKMEDLVLTLDDPAEKRLILGEIDYLLGQFEVDRITANAEPKYHSPTLQDYYAILKIPYTKALHKDGEIAARNVRLYKSIFQIMFDLDTAH